MKRTTHVRTRFAFLLVAGAVGLALGSCNLGAWKAEYRGVDLLGNRTLTIADFADSYAAGATPAFDYIDYVQITDSATYGGESGLPDTPGPVYRLEVVNLFPNGDFETTVAAATPAGWTADGSVTLLGDNTPGSAISGMSAYFGVAGTESARFDLSALLDGFVYPGTYHLNLRLRRAAIDTRTNFDYGNLSQSFLALEGIRWQSDADPANTALDVEAFPNTSNNSVVNHFAVANDPAHYFYIGAPDDAQPS